MFKVLRRIPLIQVIPKRYFSQGHHEIDRTKIILRDQKSGYFIDPNQTARRIMRIIALHDGVKDPQSLTLKSQWYQIGQNQLDRVQILLGIQEQFNIEFSDQTCQKFKDINDTVEYIARSFWSA